MAFSAFLRQVGTPVDRLLRRQGLPALCEDANVYVPLVRCWSFFESATRLEDPSLGWLIGAATEDSGLNRALLAKLASASTLLEALRRLESMARTEASRIRFGLHERGDDVLVYTYYRRERACAGYLVSQAYQLGVIRGVIRHFLGQRWHPQEVGFSGAWVPSDARSAFDGSRIVVNQPFGYVAVPRACLHRAARCAGSVAARVGETRSPTDFDFLNTLETLLTAYISEGYPTAAFASELMCTSERTLARRLAASGLTYGALVDAVCIKVAKKLLTDGELLLGDISQAVGFADQSHFARMFRRVCGLSPREFRGTVAH
jgi:AraC-like DNA-binding protein